MEVLAKQWEWRVRYPSSARMEEWAKNAQAAEDFGRNPHLDDVYRYLLYVTGNPHLAEDLAAETFERALRRWRRFDPRRAAARTWLCQLARSTALDHFRAEHLWTLCLGTAP